MAKVAGSDACFEQQSLPLAAQLQEIARNKLKNGEIDFMKYAYMTEQAQSLLLDYASLKKQVNEAAVDYHFVTFKLKLTMKYNNKNITYLSFLFLLLFFSL